MIVKLRDLNAAFLEETVDYVDYLGGQKITEAFQ